MHRLGLTVVVVVAGCIALGAATRAEERRVIGTADEFTAALDADAGEGDQIVLEPGNLTPASSTVRTCARWDDPQC